MNRRLALRGLWWKELHQMWPLAVTLLAVGGLLEILYALATAFTGEAGPNGIVLLGLPGLFAVGVGALLVGQEKEQRTIEWLSSLPIAARDIVRTKMLVGIVGLIVVWLATLILTNAMGTNPASFIAAPDLSPNQGMAWWLVHTFAVLFIGFATSWKLRSSFIALLVLLPIAALPYVITSIHVSLYDRLAWGNVILIYSLIFAFGFWWLSWQSGLQSLGPRAARSRRAGGATASEGAVFAPVRRRASPISAMIWQYAVQNRMFLGGLILLFAVSALGLQTDKRSDGTLSFISGLGIFLSCSWLGLLVFQSDSQDRRIRFFADRGIAPWKVWLTRQLIPMSLLICGSTLLVLLLPSSISAGWFMLAAAFAIYLSSQWLSQLVRSPIVGIVIAPMIGAAVVGSAGFAAVELFAAPWTLIVSGVIGLLATLAMMSNWMDGRRGWRFWSLHGGGLVLAMFVPLASFAYFLVTYPQMSGAARQRLDAIVAESPAHHPTLQTVSLLPRSMDSESEQSPVEAVSIMEQRAAQLAHLKRQLALAPDALPDYFAVRFLLHDSLLQRAHLEQLPDPQRVEQYRNAIDVITQFVRRYRSSGRLFEQDQADVLEVWLLEELKQPQAKEWMSSEIYDQALALLKDSEGRDEARRRAIALSWKNAADANLGGYGLVDTITGKSVTPREVFIAHRNAGVISELLLDLLDASESEPAPIRDRIQELVGSRMDAGQAKVFYLKDEFGERRLLYNELESGRSIGFLWRRAWETEAKSL